MTDTFTDVEASAELQKQVAQTVSSALPAGGWSESTATYLQTGRTQSLSVTLVTPGGDQDSIAIGRTVTGPWAEMRRVMSDPVKGAWLASQMVLQAQGSYRFTFTYDQWPYEGTPDILQAPEDAAIVLPTDDQWRADFQMYPRAAEYTPEWLRALVRQRDDDSDPTMSTSIQGALAAQVTWPAELAFLDGRWGWRDVFGSVADHTVERLKSGADFVVALANPGRQPEWGGWLDSVAQEVLGDVYAEILERRDTAILIRLWHTLEEGGLVNAPPGLESLDGTATIGSLSSSRPPAAARILGDVVDAMTDIIDQQLLDRFGVRPEA